jgi:hypothetical protein
VCVRKPTQVLILHTTATSLHDDIHDSDEVRLTKIDVRNEDSIRDSDRDYDIHENTADESDLVGVCDLSHSRITREVRDEKKLHEVETVNSQMPMSDGQFKVTFFSLCVCVLCECGCVVWVGVWVCVFLFFSLN